MSIMNTGLRKRLAALPFVSRADDGSLDLWNPPGKPGRFADFALGREYFARYIALVRELDAPFLTQHIFDAWADRGLARAKLCRGFMYEFGETIAAAPPEAASLFGWAPRCETPDPDEAIRALPFAATRPGTDDLDLWAVRPSGSYEQDQATGRYYAGCLARVVQATKCAWVLNAVGNSIRSDPTRREASADMRVACTHRLTEFAMTCAPEATLHQRGLAAAVGGAADAV